MVNKERLNPAADQGSCPVESYVKHYLLSRSKWKTRLQKKLTRLIKSINFWARISALGPSIEAIDISHSAMKNLKES